MTLTANQLLTKYWDKHLPVRPEMIAGACGVAVTKQYDMGKVSGYFDVIEGLPSIWYSADEPPVRQRFTVAHELGHWALDHGASFRDEPSNFLLSTRNPKEIAANKFAAELLMPSEAVNVAIAKQKVVDIDRLAKMFAVSQAAICFRLCSLGWL